MCTHILHNVIGSPSVDLHGSLGQYHEAALIQYKGTLAQPNRQNAGSGGNLDVRIRKLKQVLATSNFTQSMDSAHLVEHINLLERTSPILSAFPGTSNLQSGQGREGSSVSPVNVPPLLSNPITVHDLIVMCAYHYGTETPENLLHSPAAIKKCHKITDRQFVWAALKGRAAKGAWKDCEQIALAKGWLGGRKIKSELLPLDVAKVLEYE